MALTVPNIGEQESLRYLVNQSYNTPRNLILKLLSTDTNTTLPTPVDTDTPASLIAAAFKEPYNYATGVTAASATVGYIPCDAPYTNQFGILLDGSNWTVSTTATCTAQYPEQTFTFTGGPKYIHGYYVARANSIAQIFLNNLTGGATAAATTITATAAAATATENILGLKALKLIPVPASQPTGSGGGYNSSTFNVSANTSIAVGQYVTGTGVGPYARVTGISGTAISVSVPCTSTVSGNLNFFEGRIAFGQVVSGTGINTGAKVVGYDPTTGVVTLDLVHTGTVSTTAGGITFSFSQVSATAHGALTGDVVYIVRGSGNTTTTEGSYIITDVVANAFQTIPALDGTGSVVLYDSIMFLEKFTNGPYLIQNNGDQIKITLNVSLD